MRLGGRIQAAADVLSEMSKRHRPAADALRDWGLSHRFAGSSDRAVIGNMVYDALRWKASSEWRMDSDDALMLALSTIIYRWNMPWKDLRNKLTGDRFAPDLPGEPVTDAADARDLRAAPDWVKADVPKWIVERFQRDFAEDWLIEAQALATRPPLDLRVNTLKSDVEAELKALGRHHPKASAIARHGIRISATTADRRHPNVQVEESYQRGRIEIQDESSQIAADLVFAQPGERVLDYCAGGGGKTLALAAHMQNQGQLVAYDSDRNRLAGIYERLDRAGVENTTVLPPDSADMAGHIGQMDRVLVDAPCSGSGTWRRRPDSKWRLKPKQLGQRQNEQLEALSEAAPYVRSGGYLIYTTCSVLSDENEETLGKFLADEPAFEQVSAGEVWQDLFGFDKAQPWSSDMMSVTMTPATTDTDGFYFAVAQRIA